jgi:dolichyl-phosphate beta-glucosyltransferase
VALQPCFAVDVRHRAALCEAMPTASLNIVLVTPVWNDSTRLERFGGQLVQALAAADLRVRWMIADDGSCPAEQLKLAALQLGFVAVYPQVELIRSEQRSRKGGAIYQAWDACPEADLLAFVDADGAIDASATLHLLQRAGELGGASAVVGIRSDSAAAPVRRSWSRRLSCGLFVGLVRALLGVHFEDSQCGAKVVPAAAYRAVAPRLRERGFVFDVELLLALQHAGCRIEPLRIPWREMPGGKVSPVRDAWGMLAGLGRICKRWQTGWYG